MLGISLHDHIKKNWQKTKVTDIIEKTSRRNNLKKNGVKDYNAGDHAKQDVHLVDLLKDELMISEP